MRASLTSLSLSLSFFVSLFACPIMSRLTKCLLELVVVRLVVLKCIYMYIYVYICICICINVSCCSTCCPEMYIYVYICICICINVSRCSTCCPEMYIYVYICIYVCIHVGRCSTCCPCWPITFSFVTCLTMCVVKFVFLRLVHNVYIVNKSIKNFTTHIVRHVTNEYVIGQQEHRHNVCEVRHNVCEVRQQFLTMYVVKSDNNV